MHIYDFKDDKRASQVALVVKNLLVNPEDAKHATSIHVLGRSLGGRNGNPLQYSCLEISMDRVACLAEYSPWGHKEMDTTEHMCTTKQFQKLKTLGMVIVKWDSVVRAYCPIHSFLIPKSPAENQRVAIQKHWTTL